jgi:hypothetical protein
MDRLSNDALQSVFVWLDGTIFQETLGVVCHQWHLVARREMDARWRRDHALQTQIRRLLHELCTAKHADEIDASLLEMKLLIDHHPDRAAYHIACANASSLSPVLDAFLSMACRKSDALEPTRDILLRCMSAPLCGQFVGRHMYDTHFDGKLIPLIVHNLSLPKWIDAASIVLASFKERNPEFINKYQRLRRFVV